LSKIKDGADFASAVQTFSHDPSRDAGGDLGYVTADKLPAELRSVAFALLPGEMSAYPLQSNGLWYILEVEGRRQRPAPPLQDVRSRLMEEVSRDAARAYVIKTRDSTDIKIYGPAGPNAAEPAAAAAR
jgi:peptidyl-prolyl cis-trans isomerase C